MRIAKVTTTATMSRNWTEYVAEVLLLSTDCASPWYFESWCTDVGRELWLPIQRGDYRRSRLSDWGSCSESPTWNAKPTTLYKVATLLDYQEPLSVTQIRPCDQERHSAGPSCLVFWRTIEADVDRKKWVCKHKSLDWSFCARPAHHR